METDFSNWFKNIFFARHETFCPRYGWLKKGFDGVISDPNIFDQPDAIEVLGVGKNMVKSIRFWCMAFNIIQPIDKKTLRIAGKMEVTEFGRKIFSDADGYDPFIEDIATLWLLHWQLFTSPIIATFWSLAINSNILGSFTAKELALSVAKRIAQNEQFTRFSSSSVEKDASCFVRMYSGSEQKRADEIECPFTTLNLLSPGKQKNRVVFNLEDKNSLPNAILLAACFQYAAIMQPTLKTLSLHKITYGLNSPGAVFKLSESDIGRRVEEEVRNIERVSFIEAFGNKQFQLEQEPQELYFQLLNSYYNS